MVGVHYIRRIVNVHWIEFRSVIRSLNNQGLLSCLVDITSPSVNYSCYPSTALRFKSCFLPLFLNFDSVPAVLYPLKYPQEAAVNKAIGGKQGLYVEGEVKVKETGQQIRTQDGHFIKC